MKHYNETSNQEDYSHVHNLTAETTHPTASQTIIIHSLRTGSHTSIQCFCFTSVGAIILEIPYVE